MKFSNMAIAVSFVGLFLTGGCHKGRPTAAIGPTATATTPAPSTSKEHLPQESPYKKTTTIFQEFAKLIEENQDAPDQGFAKCRVFATSKIPELRNLTGQIKAIETSPKTADYMHEIMDANARIKLATDTVTKIAQEKYGVKGADVMLVLADLALARL